MRSAVATLKRYDVSVVGMEKVYVRGFIFCMRRMMMMLLLVVHCVWPLQQMLGWGGIGGYYSLQIVEDPSAR